MTFLNPLVLFGMIAAAIPVILHLLNLRKLRTIEFSTLRFLKELQQTKIRRLKMRQILLLIIRTLLVLAIVLAFARPALRGTLLGTIGANAHSSVVFIFDDSFSMTFSDERGELLKQAKESVITMIDLLNEGDEVYFIKLSDLPDATPGQATHDFQALKKLINEIQVSSVTRPMQDAVRLSAKLLSESKNANKEVYVVSDMQQGLFTDALQPQQASPSLFDAAVRFFQLNIGSASPANVAVDSVEVRTQIMEKNKPVSVYTSVRNFSGNTIQSYVVSVFLEGVRVAQNSVRLDPWGSASLEFTVSPKKSGFVKGYIEVENDAVDRDNRRYFTLYVPERISLAFVSNSQNDAKFPLLALSSEGVQDSQYLFESKHVTFKEFQFIDLEKLDVLMLSFPDGIVQGGIERIKNFVTNGGGLVLFPSSNFQNDDMARALLSSLSIRSIEGVTGGENAQSSVSFKEIDFDHPLFATVFEKNQQAKNQSRLSVESPSVLKTLQRVVSKEAHAIVRLSDGSAFLSEHKLGSGKILFYSVAPVLQWSDFPLKGIFPPMVYRSAVYVSSRGKSHYTFTAGDEPVLTLPNLPVALRTGVYKLISPDGVEELVSQLSSKELEGAGFKSSGSSLTVSLKKLTQTGFYQFMNQSELLTTIAVNSDKKESDGRKIEENQLSEFWSRLGVESGAVTTLDRPEQVQSAIVESRFGVELWKYCIAFALLLALLEMLLARDSRKEMQQAFREAA